MTNEQAFDVEPGLRECLSIREQASKKNHSRIEDARRVLGECLTREGADPSLALGARIEKLREAETILIELGNAVVGDSTSSDDDKTDAIQRVVDLYKVWHAAEPAEGYDAKADEWRAKLGEEGAEGRRREGTEEEEPGSPPATRPASAAPDDTDGSE